MRIAFVISSRAMAGMELRAARVARLAAARGHDMHFGCPAGSLLDGQLAEYGITRFSLRMVGSLDLYGGLRLASYLRRAGIELVMPFSGKDYWMTVLAARLAGAAVLINRSTANSVNPVSVPLMKAADGIVAVSGAIRDVLTAQSIPEEKVSVVYLGVDPEVFSPEKCPSREEVRHRHGLPRDAFVVGSFARTGKGQRILLETDSLLAGHRERLHYFFAGEFIPERIGPFVAERPALEGRVTLKDLVPYEEVPELLSALDAVVMLPEREPFSNSVIEAMAMAKPVILSRTLGNIEAVEDGRSGVLIDRGDRRALAAALRRLLENPQEAKEMGRAASRRVRTRFTEAVMMDGMEALWRKLTG
jgi:glycosyltransferase involved in cell wall biosynthesis